MVYPLVLEYLRDCAPGQWALLMRPELLAKDQYWGTARQVTEPRSLPEGFIAGSKGDRDRQTQQVLVPKAHKHLKEIKKFYRVKLGNLIATAINYAWGKLDR